MVRIVIGTRGSSLALRQAEQVADLLRESDSELVADLQVIRTSGDRLIDRPLATVGGKGLFIKEIEEALLAGRIDCAVHSLKDVPGQLAEGCALAAVLKRTDAFDALCLPPSPSGSRGSVVKRIASNDGIVRPATGEGTSPAPTAGAVLAELPAGASVGTSSLRRRTQLLALRPGLGVCPIRGNVDTRLRKLDSGEVDALVLARAGLARLGLEDRIDACFSMEEMIPAVGQGVLAVEVRDDDDATRARLEFLQDPETRVAADAERAFLRSLGGSCKVPMGAHAVVDGPRQHVNLVAFVGDADGDVLRAEADGPFEEAAALGAQLAEKLLARGGAELLMKVGASVPGWAGG